MKLPKLANWFSDEDPQKQRSQTPPETETESTESELPKIKLEHDKLNNKLELTRKELVQAQAQLQISQGFRIELGETHQKLQQTEAELQRRKRELFEREKELQIAQAQLQKTNTSLAYLMRSQNWLTQLRIPVKVAKIAKTLPKQDFETLWGFGIISPTANTILNTGTIMVRGWVLGKRSPAHTVVVKYGAETILTTPVKLRRPVVAQQYPDIPQARDSGFDFSLAVTNLSKEIELSLEVLLADKTTVPLCNFILQPKEIESLDT